MTTRLSSSSSCASPGNSLRMPPFARLPTSRSRPPAPWSVPRRVVVLGPPAELAPDHGQHAVARARARRGRPARRAASRRGPAADRRAPWPARRACRSRRSRRRDARAEARAEHASEVAERLAEIAVGVGHRRRRRACPPWPAARGGRASRSCCRTSSARRPGRVLRACPREPAVGRQEGLLVPHVRDVEAEVARARRRWRRARGCAFMRRILAPADVDALQRVVVRADHVERAPEPAGAVGRRPDDAAAPVAARVEVRLVGVRVVDRRQHGDLAGVVELAQAGEAGVPAEARARRRAAAPSPGRRRCASAAARSAGRRAGRAC